MWKKVALIATLLCITSLAFADTIENYPKITKIEEKLYNHSYVNEDIYQRLSRIEASLHKTITPDMDLATRVDNLTDELQISAMPGYLTKDIDYLEETNFHKTFNKDNPDKRIERLEYHLIGAVQDGNYQDRLFKLKSLNDQNSVAQYFDANSNLYDIPASSEPVKSAHPKWQKAQDAILFLAPFLFGLL